MSPPSGRSWDREPVHRGPAELTGHPWSGGGVASLWGCPWLRCRRDGHEVLRVITGMGHPQRQGCGRLPKAIPSSSASAMPATHSFTAILSHLRRRRPPSSGLSEPPPSPPCPAMPLSVFGHLCPGVTACTPFHGKTVRPHESGDHTGLPSPHAHMPTARPGEGKPDWRSIQRRPGRRGLSLILLPNSTPREKTEIELKMV